MQPDNASDGDEEEGRRQALDKPVKNKLSRKVLTCSVEFL